jgi:60 kDa SS-A/Ro ribonucleoprotein
MVNLVAERLRDPKLVAQSKAFPYQLLAAYKNVSDDMPSRIVNALQDAMELAVANVPRFDSDAAVLVDTSGSMKNPVTGHRVGSTSKVRCVDVAALFASAVLRHNPDSTVTPFDTRVHDARLNARDAVMTNATTLARFGGGGTNCGMALEHLNKVQSMAEIVIYFSDNESWMDQTRTRATGVMEQWTKYKNRVPAAKLVCVDLTPNRTTQARDRHDILNVGGFSDEVFNIIKLFARGDMTGAHWVGEIEKVVL